MRKPWRPPMQEAALWADMLAAGRPKAAIAKFVYVSESTLRRFLARVRARRHAGGRIINKLATARPASKVGNGRSRRRRRQEVAGVTLRVTPDAIQPIFGG
jgi:hypothetical protein